MQKSKTYRNMTFEELKSTVSNLKSLDFRLFDGQEVAAHFHLTEVGHMSRNFIDCGGKTRRRDWVNLQLWVANDTEHRLSPKKLLGILNKGERAFNLQADWEVEVEFQQNTIGKFGLDFVEGQFVLLPTQTDCLAKDNCGVPAAGLLPLNARQLRPVVSEPAGSC